ncbi:inner-membrane translocator [Halorubrum salipaludis]|uniref:Inner-membrane translocator n=1 Tax=Halorubrum salipaludis TaxID=2032630 RepID=A0A2A2FEA4_9EURY|nr:MULTISPECIES: branched-chain amino acid ABC transporter permease [Halorubrum]PAU83007.1 inner-membrane translocator [Halorubrum salipaludis]
MSTETTRSGLTWDRLRIPVVVAVLAALPLLFFDPSYTYISRLFILTLVFATLALALNIVFGHTDQLFLFVGALTGIGAYATALTADALGVSPWVTLLFGATLAGVLGALVCYVAARRRFTVILIAILTLSLQLAIIEIFVGARDITGGSTGFRFSGLGLESVQNALGVHEHMVLYYVVLALLTGVLALYHYIRNSKYGMAFDAIRQDEIAAEAIGVDVVRYKTLAGFVSAFVIGLTGPMYAQLESLVLPGMFEFNVIDVLVLIILIVGGIRTMLGPIVGAAVIIYVNEELQATGQWRTVVFGFLLIVLFLYFRSGIVPYLDDVLNERLGLKARIRSLVAD